MSRLSLQRMLTLSIIIHILLIYGIWKSSQYIQVATNPSGKIAVTLWTIASESEDNSDPESPRPTAAQAETGNKAPKKAPKRAYVSRSTPTSPTTNDSGAASHESHEGGMHASATGGGDSLEGSNRLVEIRRRIEAVKRYPPMARRAALQGLAEISFHILPSGDVVNVKLTSSSGHKLLDDEALKAVKRSAPLPYYPDRVIVRLAFSTL